MGIGLRSKTEEVRLSLIKRCANYIVSNNCTIREAAKEFGISKSWLHNCIEEMLQKRDIKLYNKVREVLDRNKSGRHLRGGMATKKKYEMLKNKK